MSEPELLGDIVGDLYPVCKHPRTEIRYKVIADGRKQLCTQCLECGSKTDGSKWLPQAGIDMSKVVAFDECLAETYKAEQNRNRTKKLASERRERHEEYERYIRESDDWWDIRTKVMQRDDHLCQSCRENTAEEVHHKDYTHLYDEVLYDLVAVCRTCHAKIHGKL